MDDLDTSSAQGDEPELLLPDQAHIAFGCALLRQANDIKADTRLAEFGAAIRVVFTDGDERQVDDGPSWEDHDTGLLVLGFAVGGRKQFEWPEVLSCDVLAEHFREGWARGVKLGVQATQSGRHRVHLQLEFVRSVGGVMRRTSWSVSLDSHAIVQLRQLD